MTRLAPDATASAGGLGRPSRRAFCCGAASLLVGQASLLRASAQAPPATAFDAFASTRPDVAAIDRERILSAAAEYLSQPPTPLTSLPCPRSPGTLHNYYSEPTPQPTLDSAPPPKAANAPPPFTAHRDALLQLGLAVPALAAAHLLTSEERYADHAVLQLRAWFLDPATRMTPSLDYTQVVPAPTAAQNAAQDSTGSGTSAPVATGRYQGLVEALPLVEIAQAIPFLAASSALSQSQLAGLHAWFAAYLRWLTALEGSGSILTGLARDSKDHHGTSWLLQASAYANLAVLQGDVAKSEDSTLAALRRRFRTVTLRAQISADGTFPHELQSASPYRDSLFNLDMMAGVCQLLSTRFESAWEYQLEDGPGMRAAIAYHFPYIADRTMWPFRADVQHFEELPSRRASLLLTAHAYQRPEYAALWKKLKPDPPTPDILRTIPIHQPLLWVRQPPRVVQG